MELLKELDIFLRSEPVLQFWQRFHIVLLWISLPLTAIALWLFISVDRKYERLKRQIKQELDSAGMEEIRDFFKPLLKEHGIEADDKQHEQN